MEELFKKYRKLMEWRNAQAALLNKIDHALWETLCKIYQHERAAHMEEILARGEYEHQSVMDTDVCTNTTLALSEQRTVPRMKAIA